MSRKVQIYRKKVSTNNYSSFASSEVKGVKEVITPFGR